MAPDGERLLILRWRDEVWSDEGYDYVVAVDATDLSQRWQLGPCPAGALSVWVSPTHIVAHVRAVGYRVFDGGGRELSHFRLSESSELRGELFGFSLSTLASMQRPSEAPPSRVTRGRLGEIEVGLEAGPAQSLPSGRRRLTLLTSAEVGGTTLWRGGPGFPAVYHGMLFGECLDHRGLVRLDPSTGEVLAMHGFTDWSTESTAPFQIHP